jgi:nucleotide-binding universal stress UspA family protein
MTEVLRPSIQSALTPDAAPAPRQIIAAASGRADDESVLAAAHLLAARDGVEVTVLSVIEPLAPLMGEAEEPLLLPGLSESQAATRLEGVTRLVEREGGGWPVEIRYGRPAETIAAEASVSGAELIVMGIGRHKPIDRLLATETTLATVRRASCPVFAVAGRIRRLPRVAVAATDFGPASIRAVQAALPLLANNATLYLLHVWSRAGVTHPALEATDAAYERSLPERFARLRDLLAAPPRSITVKTVELVGRPADEILEFARGHRADLVIAGTHGRGFVDRLLVGSVATSLLRGASCSVLIAPEAPLPAERRADDHAAADVPRELTSAERLTAGEAEGWAKRLEEFARRNHGRRAVLEAADRRIGAYSFDSGYALLGAAYDPRTGRAELALGDPARDAPALRHAICEVTAVDVVAGAAGRDRSLSLAGRGGQVRIRFVG